MTGPGALRRSCGAALAIACLIGLAPQPADADTWPDRPVTMVVPFSPGGSVDRMARSVATHLAREVGQPINVVNRPGAGGQVGSTVFLTMPDDGSTLLVTATVPFLINNIMTGADYTLDDFHQVNAQWVANGSIMAHAGTPYETMEDLVTAIVERPGEVSAGVIGQSAEHLTLLLLLDSLEVPRSNVRLVTYDGGGPVRTAVAGGQVDFAVITAQGSEAILDRVRVLALVSDEAVEGWDHPLINDALAGHGVEIPILQSSVRSVVVHSGFPEQHPEAYDAFLAAYRRTLESEAYREFAAQNDIEATWRGPERSQQIVDQSFGMIQSYSSLLDD